MILIKNKDKIPPLGRGDTMFWYCSNKKKLSVVIDKNKEGCFILYSITSNSYLKYPTFSLKNILSIISDLHIIKADGTVYKYVS